MKINNLKINNPILNVFNKEYRNEYLYHNYMKEKISEFKLKNNEYDLDEGIKLLKKVGYTNNYNGKLS